MTTLEATHHMKSTEVIEILPEVLSVLIAVIQYTVNTAHVSHQSHLLTAISINGLQVEIEYLTSI